MSENSDPYLIKDINGAGEALERISLESGVFQETWLQELLDSHPTILPLNLIDDSFSNHVSIGREIANIDNLFINSKGLLTIVETKLWRNPEAHRTVVAQILDYAKTLSTWEFKELDTKVRNYCQKNRGKPLGMYDLVKNHDPRTDLDSIDFEASVQEALTAGKFILLIVGDKIRPEATQLAEIIQSAPHMQFRMAFIELQCHRLNSGSDWPLVVFPKLILKTKEVTRAVVKVVYEKEKPEVEITAPSEKVEKETSSGKISFDEFVASLPSNVKDHFITYLEGWIKSDMVIYWGTVGFSLRIPHHKKLTTIFDAYPDSVSICTDKDVEKKELPRETYQAYKEKLMRSRIFGNAFVSGRKYLKYNEISGDEAALLLKATDEFARSVCRQNN